MWTIWSRRREFWRRIPTASHVTFLAGIFLMFMSGGLLDDLSNLGSNPPSRLVAGMMISGGLTVAYVLAFRWPRWLVGVKRTAPVLSTGLSTRSSTPCGHMGRSSMIKPCS